MPVNFYIYYRVNPAGAVALEARIHEMQAALHNQNGIAGRLLKKRDEPLLWMEVYENVDDAESFEDAMVRIVEEYRIRQFLEPGSQRHSECFVV
ncbi:MAG TPA: DUF4936 family protein [Burkholderiales bacterium]|nr:DUF4936 family protein [Burkholderiales bacterium]